MKKLFLAAFAVFAFASVNAQELRAGLTGGLPIGDFSDAYSFSFGLDASYLWEVSEDFSAGIATGYATSPGDSQSITILGITTTIDAVDFSYIPLAAAGRFNASEGFVLGADIGYAIATGDGDGGFYYRPMVGYNISEEFQITASYRGVSVNGGSFSTVNLGVNYKFM